MPPRKQYPSQGKLSHEEYIIKLQDHIQLLDDRLKDAAEELKYALSKSKEDFNLLQDQVREAENEAEFFQRERDLRDAKIEELETQIKAGAKHIPVVETASVSLHVLWLTDTQETCWYCKDNNRRSKYKCACCEKSFVLT